MSGRPGRNLLYVLVAVVGLAYLILLRGKGPSVEDVVRPVGAIASVLALLVIAWDVFLWRAPGLNRLAKIPNIRGTWRGTLRSSWVNPETGRALSDDDVYLVVRQNFWSVSSQFMTEESKSQSLTGTVVNVGDGQYSLTCVYQNVPRALIRQRSPIHHGALMLDVGGARPTHLEGFYWTDRGTKGELLFRARSSKLVPDFRTAQGLGLSTAT